jgi:hypothetical protein
MKILNFFIFVGHFRPPRSGSLFKMRNRIRIQQLKLMRIYADPSTTLHKARVLATKTDGLGGRFFISQYPARKRGVVLQMCFHHTQGRIQRIQTVLDPDPEAERATLKK